MNDTASFDTDVRVALYRDFVESGHAPSAARLAQVARATEVDIRAALERLAAARAIVLQPESREVLMANPLCAVPTPYLVRAGQQIFFGSCVWDALGIMAMLRRDAVLETSCACCGEVMTVEAAGGSLQPAPGIIHFSVPARRWWENIFFT